MEIILKPFDGRFLHGVNLGEWYPCWNLTLAGRLWSPDFLAIIEPGLRALHRSIRDVPIETLRVAGGPQGVPTPRALWYVCAAAWARDGAHIGIGAKSTNWLGRDELERIRRLGDIELSFEDFRRRLQPDSASRLASLYVAEDSHVGRAHILNMLGPDTHILRVSIPLAIRVTQADTTWFDLYCSKQDPQYIEGYWSSKPYDSNAPTWEYLVDGMIEVDDPQGLEHVRQFGAKLPRASGDVLT